ncbi:hypothetical protein [Rudaeicoccus suwonensis]|uniref:hypothetical protein n=1 Tax=Rudaeicoccus suwonensis TaxID=657409 RepID=UPI001477219A|nr:hypothetical protein [Rudaeicoccus suwonensis]
MMVAEAALWAVDDPVLELVELPSRVVDVNRLGLVTMVFGIEVSDGVVDAAPLAELHPAIKTPATMAAPSTLPLRFIRPPPARVVVAQSV